MLHFTPLYKPSKGYMRLEKWEGDIGVRSPYALIYCLLLQLSFVPYQLSLLYVVWMLERICTSCIDRAYLDSLPMLPYLSLLNMSCTLELTLYCFLLDKVNCPYSISIHPTLPRLNHFPNGYHSYHHPLHHN